MNSGLEQNQTAHVSDFFLHLKSCGYNLFPAVIDCGNLTAPEGGQVTFAPGVVMTLETGLDAIATYTCSEGYDLVGDAMRACQENQQWAGPEPNCSRK